MACRAAPAGTRRATNLEHNPILWGSVDRPERLIRQRHRAVGTGVRVIGLER